jgi:hypothetical protein
MPLVALGIASTVDALAVIAEATAGLVDFRYMAVGHPVLVDVIRHTCGSPPVLWMAFWIMWGNLAGFLHRRYSQRVYYRPEVWVVAHKARRRLPIILLGSRDAR